MRFVIVDNAIHMEPEREQDHAVFDLLKIGFVMAGFGREQTGETLHVQVPIEPVSSAAEADRARKTCCGEGVATRFCPHCGAVAGGHDLMTLLAHCRHAMAQAEACYADSEARESERSMEIKLALLRKWSAWVAALESIVGK